MDLWKPVRTASAPLRHSLRTWVTPQSRIQRTVPLRPEDRTHKRRRWHVLVDLLNEHCPGDALKVAEIGTNIGITTAHLIRYCPNIERIYTVDLRHPSERDHDFLTGLERVTFIQESSDTAARHVEDDSLDLVFIDADHTAAWVQKDLDAWVPKVRPGGVIAGHDYGSHTHVDVKPVVDRFFADHAHPVRVESNRVFWTLR